MRNGCPHTHDGETRGVDGSTLVGGGACVAARTVGRGELAARRGMAESTSKRLAPGQDIVRRRPFDDSAAGHHSRVHSCADGVEVLCQPVQSAPAMDSF